MSCWPDDVDDVDDDGLDDDDDLDDDDEGDQDCVTKTPKPGFVYNSFLSSQG